MALYSVEYEKAQADPTEYLANPINAYLLVKRLTTDWKNIENLLKDDIYQGTSYFLLINRFFSNCLLEIFLVFISENLSYRNDE